MKITRRTDYAIHLISELSEQGDKPMGLRVLSEKHKVTYAFARTVQQGLLKAGIIKTSRGINGGIVLAKPLADITLLDVFESAQNPLEVTFDSANAPWCDCEGACITADFWKSTCKVMHDHLAKITMADLVKGKKKK